MVAEGACGLVAWVQDGKCRQDDEGKWIRQREDRNVVVLLFQHAGRSASQDPNVPSVGSETGLKRTEICCLQNVGYGVSLRLLVSALGECVRGLNRFFSSTKTIFGFQCSASFSFIDTKAVMMISSPGCTFRAAAPLRAMIPVRFSAGRAYVENLSPVVMLQMSTFSKGRIPAASIRDESISMLPS